MRKWIACLSLLALLAGASMVRVIAQEHAGGTATTITGAVVDVACWVKSGARGEKHKGCATACAKAGGALGILEDTTNKLYIAVAPKPGGDPKEKLMEHIAHKVEVTGSVATRGDVSTIAVQSVKMAAEK